MSYKVMVRKYSLSFGAKWDVSRRKLALSIFYLAANFYMHYKMHFLSFMLNCTYIYYFFSHQLEIKYYYYQGDEGGSWVQDFLVLPRRVEGFPSVLSWTRWGNLVGFFWRLILVCDGCEIWEHLQFQGNEMFPGLIQDVMDGYIKLFYTSPVICWTAASQ